MNINKIPYLGTIAKDIASTRRAIGRGEKMKALHHGTRAATDVVFPPFIAKVIYDSVKKKDEPMNPVAAGFQKEAVSIMGIRRAIGLAAKEAPRTKVVYRTKYKEPGFLRGTGMVAGKAVKALGRAGKAVVQFPFKHPGVTAAGLGGLALGSLGQATASTLKDPRARRTYGPESQYQGQFR